MRECQPINNLGPPVNLCQWARVFFAGLALLLGVSGCNDTDAPGYDDLRSQLLREACDELRDGKTEDAIKALERLAEVAPGDPFAASALARLEEYRTVVTLNDAIAAGDLPGAQELLAGATGESWRAAAAAAAPLEALEALQTYLDNRPFSRAVTWQAALTALVPYVDVLQKTPAGAAFLAAERRALEALQQREKGIVVDAILGALDRAAVSGSPTVEALLAHLSVAAPDHPVLHVWTQVLNGSGMADPEIREYTGSDAMRRSLEIGMCLAWNEIKTETWASLTPALQQCQAASLAGQLLRTAIYAESHQWSEAMQSLRSLAASATPHEKHLARLLRAHVLPPTQVQAWCWQTPCPGVPELLSRIAQLQTHQVK